MTSPKNIYADLVPLYRDLTRLVLQTPHWPAYLDAICERLQVIFPEIPIGWGLLDDEGVPARFRREYMEGGGEKLSVSKGTFRFALFDESAQPRGVLVVECAALSEELQQVFLQIAEQLSYVLNLHTQRMAMHDQLKSEQLFSRISQEIGKTFNIEDILQFTAEELVRFFHASRCIIFRYDTNDLEHPISVTGQAVSEPKTMPPLADEDLPNAAVRQRLENMVFQPVHSASDAEAPDIIAICKKYDISSYSRVYVLYRGIPLGQIVVAQSDFKRIWSEAEVEILDRVASLMGAALYQAELYQNEQAAKEAAREANLRKNQFIASLTHDLRTPLQSILGGSAMMHSQMLGPLNEKQLSYTERISKSGEHLLMMIDDLLDIARIEAGHFSVELEAMDVGGWLEQAVATMEPLFRRKNQQVSLFFNEELPRWIHGDIHRLSQVMINLLSNACKFTPEKGEICIHAGLEGEQLVVHVEDQGVGIAPDDLSIIFEPFERGRQSGGSEEGTGLGLTIAKSIVELHHGQVHVASEPNQGSTFSIFLPINAGSGPLPENSRMGAQMRVSNNSAKRRIK